MRSSLIGLVVVAGCAKADQVNQCYPVASWSAPVFECAAGVMPLPPPPEPPPPPPPEPETPHVELKSDKIELREKVNFETAKATLLPESMKLLDEVVAILEAHPEIKRVRIEGHTDSRGDDAFNLRLPDDRARSVRQYLISRGIDAKRLESKGYGKTKPIADNGTPEGQDQNRRVEIYIVEKN